MTALLRSEWRKLTATKLGWALLAGALAIVALGTGFTLWGPMGDDASVRVDGVVTSTVATQADLVDMLGVAMIIAVFTLIYGLTTVTGEFRHDTAATTFLATPDRWRVLAAKSVITLVVSVAYLAAAVLLVLAFVAVDGVVGESTIPLGGEVARYLGLATLSVTSSALFGVGLGAVIRSQVAAIVGVLVWMFVAESLLSGLLPDVARWTPFAAGTAITGDGAGGALAPLLATTVAFGWAVAALGGGAWLTERRDVV